MKYHNLDDTSANEAWKLFIELDEEWKKDPTNKEKFLASRRAFGDYDEVRIKFYKLEEN